MTTPLGDIMVEWIWAVGSIIIMQTIEETELEYGAVPVTLIINDKADLVFTL